MRILIFGDTLGIPQLLRHIDAKHLVAIVGADIRPQYHAELGEIAEKYSLPFLIQPKWKSDEYIAFIADIEKLNPDLIWVNSYSMIIRQEVLDIPRLGGINIHGALLPEYRGCNPIQWAILGGEIETGVTLHEISAGIDEGNIIDQLRVPLFFEDTWQTALNRIFRATDGLITRNMKRLLSGEWVAKPQGKTNMSYCRRRTPEDGLFDWEESVRDIHNKIRALVPPLPAAFYLNDDSTREYIHEILTPHTIFSLKAKYKKGAWLESNSINLRVLRENDISVLIEYWKFIQRPSATLDYMDWLNFLFTQCMDTIIFVIEDSKNSQIIGLCQLFNIDWQTNEAELGVCWPNKNCQSVDRYLETVNLLCETGVQELGIRRMQIKIPDKVELITAAKQNHFLQEGVLKEAIYEDGDYQDLILMAKLSVPDSVRKK